jgi:hypothetical protein
MASKYALSEVVFDMEGPYEEPYSPPPCIPALLVPERFQSTY